MMHVTAGKQNGNNLTWDIELLIIPKENAHGVAWNRTCQAQQILSRCNRQDIPSYQSTMHPANNFQYVHPQSLNKFQRRPLNVIFKRRSLCGFAAPRPSHMNTWRKQNIKGLKNSKLNAFHSSFYLNHITINDKILTKNSG